MGGLGNQLFQYAMGRAVAHRRRTVLKLDIEQLEQDSLRSYTLHHLNTVAEVALECERTRVTGETLRGWRKSLFVRLQRRLPYFRRTTIYEKQKFVYDPNLKKVPCNVYLSGYWQNQRYFRSIQNLLRQELTLKRPPSVPSQALLQQIRSIEAVSLHVRRGDYVSNPKTYQNHGLSSLAYYAQAVNMIAHHTQSPHFFIFSDDIDWVRQNMMLDFPTTYVTHNGTERDYEDFCLMSQCKHHIIANSSFSWWAAWLHDDGQKVIIAPERWFRVDKFDTSDLLPAHWYKL
jgi:hypothetical protein